MCGGCQYFSLPLIPAFGTQVFNSVAHSRRWTPKHFNQKYFYRRRQISITTKLQNTLYTSAWWTFVNTYHNMQSDGWKCSKSFHNMFIWHCHKLYAIKLLLWYDDVITWMHAPHGPLTRYVKLQVAHAPGMPGTFSPAADFKGNC